MDVLEEYLEEFNSDIVKGFFRLCFSATNNIIKFFSEKKAACNGGCLRFVQMNLYKEL